jgi:hypothetical protein
MKKSGRGVKSNPANKRPAFQGHLIALEPRMMFDGAGVTTASAIALSNDASIFDIGLLPQFVDADSSNNSLHFMTDFGPAPALVNDRNTLQPTDNLDIAIGDMLAHFDSGYLTNLDINQDGDVSGDGEAVDIVAAPSNDFIFIDTNVVGYQTLASEWSGRGTIALIDGSSNGIEQMNAALAGASNVGAIHIVSHGADGMFWLGTTRVTADAVNGELRSSFAAIGSALSADGDLLIYGCDTGVGDAGQSLLDSLARTTGADVAASIDDTGSMLRGGDWTLENRLGVVESASLVARDWDGLLAPAALAGSPTGLTVNGTAVTTQSALVGAGAVARWANVATINGVQVDLVATVGSITNASGVRFNAPGQGGTLNDDFGVLIVSSAGTGNASAVVNWTIVRTGTNTPVNTDVTFTVADIDGTGIAFPPTRESVVVSTDTLSSYQASNGSRVRFDPLGVPGQVTAYGTADENGAAESGARLIPQAFRSRIISTVQIPQVQRRLCLITMAILISTLEPAA